MLWGMLAGAGLFALIDATARVSLPDRGMWRETVLVTVAGDLALAVLAWLLLRAAFGLARRPAPRPATGLWLGAALAAAPFLGNFLDPEPLGLGGTLLLGGLAPWIGRLTPFPASTFAALALPAPLLAVFLWFLPPSDLAAGAPPELPAGPAAAPPDSPGRPDLLLVSVDTLRADRLLSLAGELPVLSALRARGLWAEYGLSSTNQTVPAHATLLSGLDAMSHGVRHNHDLLGDSIPLFTSRLREAGYVSAAVVSNGLLRASMGFGRGFDAYDDTLVSATGRKLSFRRMLAKHSWTGWLLGSDFINQELMPRLTARLRGPGAEEGGGRRTVEHAVAYLRRLQAGSRPYFLFVHFLDPHHPYKPPAATAGRYFAADSLPERYRDLAPGSDPLLQRLRRDLERQDEEARRAAAALSRLYDEEVLYVDQLLGELLAAVERGGRPTVILFTSDHGEHFGEHDRVLHSNSLYEELVRVPFVLAGPGVTPGELAVTPHLEDVAPTLLSLAGLPADGFTGRDLSRGLPAPRGHVERYSSFLAVREGDWKLIARLTGGTVQPLELFDLAADPKERHNLLGERPEIAQRLQLLAEAAAARDAARGRPAAALSEEHQALLQELGYAGGDPHE